MSRPLEMEKVRSRSRRLPDWLRKNLAPGREAESTDALLKHLGLHTICESGRCPNRNECYSQKTATFMIMGDICTRSCRFCSVNTGRPDALDVEEPRRVAEAVRVLGLKHVVVTSVNRDDLEDEGVSHFVSVIRGLKNISPDLIIEILTPDFKRTQRQAVRSILREEPDIFNHNVETVPALYRKVRPQGDYEKSLEIFREIKRQSDPSARGSNEPLAQDFAPKVALRKVLTKSGLMLGLGETREEILEVLRDLRGVGCDILTLGQYLQSSSLGLPVEEYIHPDIFLEYKNEALEMGFTWVESGPFVRSSFYAKDSFEALKASLKARRIKIG